MKYRKLGRTDILLSEVGLGTWELSGNSWGKKPESRYMEVLHSAIDHGVNFIDTALEYGNGSSERVIGKALSNLASGKEIVICTKVPPKCMRWSPPFHDSIESYFPSDWIIKCCDLSLKNLNRDNIDILLLHTWNPAWSAQAEWHETLLTLKSQGKIRAFGISVSDMRPSEANVQVSLEMVDVIMAVFNVFEQEPLYTLLPLATKHGVGVIARCPFSSGALAGDWSDSLFFSTNDWRAKWTDAQWVQTQNFMAQKVEEMLEPNEMPLAWLALRFVLHSPFVTSVIPGTSNPRHAIENAEISNSPPLRSSLYQSLLKLWTSGAVHAVYNGG